MGSTPIEHLREAIGPPGDEANGGASLGEERSEGGTDA